MSGRRITFQFPDQSETTSEEDKIDDEDEETTDFDDDDDDDDDEYNKEGGKQEKENKGSKKLEKLEKTQQQNTIPHQIFLDFLLERFELVRRKSRIEMDLFHRILQKSFANPDDLSYLPSSIGARFRLILLGMYFTQGNYMSSSGSKMMMRHRIYRAALSWFFCQANLVSCQDQKTNRI
eukprot:Anaeramoba_flamelloidesc42577_g1_i1.p2 GENE.c42577_g1_i1~~c42577_g1_i1.p2  ORF type:complete len:179 (+),score=43.10 c42577_g1_i1:34-570(+)